MRLDYCNRIEQAVRRLPRLEQRLIECRYMGTDSDYITNYNVFNEQLNPPMSETKYTGIRGRAFYKIVLFLIDSKVIKPEAVFKETESLEVNIRKHLASCLLYIVRKRIKFAL